MIYICIYICIYTLYDSCINNTFFFLYQCNHIRIVSRYAYIYIYRYTHAHTLLHIHMHTHMHTHIHICQSSLQQTPTLFSRAWKTILSFYRNDSQILCHVIGEGFKSSPKHHHLPWKIVQDFPRIFPGFSH